MQAAELANFWRLLGHRVIETKSGFWFNPEPLRFKSLPGHRLISPGKGEIAKVLLKGRAIALRYPSAALSGQEDGGLFVCADHNYDYVSLTANARSHTRRGLARCKVEPISFDYLSIHGRTLTDETFRRQTGRPSRTTQAQWERYCGLAGKLPGFEAWGAFVGDTLAAFAVTMLIEDCLFIHLQKSRSDLLKFYPNNALVFVLLKTKLACPEVGFVSNGLKGLAVKNGLDHFKLSMGFQLRPHKENVIINPLFKPAANLLGRPLLARLTRRYPDTLIWKRAYKALMLGAYENPSLSPSKQPLGTH